MAGHQPVYGPTSSHNFSHGRPRQAQRMKNECATPRCRKSRQAREGALLLYTHNTGITHTATAKWDIKFFAVAEEAGLQQYYREHSSETGFREAASRTEGITAGLNAWACTVREEYCVPDERPTCAQQVRKSRNCSMPRCWREETIDKGASLPAEMHSPVELKACGRGHYLH